MRPAAAALLLTLLGAAALAQEEGAGAAASGGFLEDHFGMVARAQDSQPHWISPLFTTTPRLNERFRYDFSFQSRPGNVDLANYGSGKGLELILADRVAVTFGIPSYLVRDAPRGAQSGWADETFQAKYRFASAPEQSGNYVFSAFLGVSVPTGSDALTAKVPVYTPTLAFGKGWGSREVGFDIQSTLGVSVPGGDKARVGMPVVWSTTFQAHVARYLWPEFEVALTHWTDGPSNDKWQAIATAGVVLGRFPISRRLHFDVGAGYQWAISSYRTYDGAWLATARLPF
ncbi:MAG TPA: transporter [Thermoanaerobaculia bacterium]|nr:transporter [Thermoanaerobaculia bacterium]